MTFDVDAPQNPNIQIPLRSGIKLLHFVKSNWMYEFSWSLCVTLRERDEMGGSENHEIFLGVIGLINPIGSAVGEHVEKSKVSNTHQI